MKDERIVVKDSRAGLWHGVKEGLILSTDLTEDGKLRPSLTPTPRDSLLATPFEIQKPPTFYKQQKLPPRRPLGEIDVNVLRSELRRDDHKRAAEEAALEKIKEGIRALELLREM